MVDLNHDSTEDVIIASSPGTRSSTGRCVHTFDSCEFIRSRKTRKPMNTRRDDVTLCTGCERRLLDGEDPDVHPDVFEAIEA